MNYRHAFHAGNFADVHKHAVLALAIMHLRDKATAFRIIDTHAGAGLYDLSGPEASRTGEWQGGIGRIYARALDPALGLLLAPYLTALASFNPDGRLVAYPGSPALARALLRPQDRLIACESEPKAARALAAALGGERRAKAIAIDGWTALSAYVPPKERRGLVLIDPPFERADEFARLGQEVAKAHRRWPTGIYMLWYPIKDRSGPDALAEHFARAGIAKILRAELLVDAPRDPQRLKGSGLMVINPPWGMADELAQLLPALAVVLARDNAGSARLDWLRREK